MGVELSGQVALVTGASSVIGLGIGLGIAHPLDIVVANAGAIRTVRTLLPSLAEQRPPGPSSGTGRSRKGS